MSEEKVIYEIVARNETCKEKPPAQPPRGFGARHAQALILFVCLTAGYTMRAQLSVSMVAMTSHQFSHNSTRHLSDTPNVSSVTGDVGDTFNVSVVTGGFNDTFNKTNMDATGGLSKWNVYRKYDWDKPTQEMILFSFFAGYTTMMLPMGCIAQKFGGKVPVMVALGVNGVISIVTPWVPIFGGWLAVSVCRFLQGTTQAAFYPSIHTMLGKWAPLSERGRLSTYVYTGSQFGTIVIFLIAGVFAGSPGLGWPATFWLCGALSLCCFLLLWWLGAATPHEHPNISAEEITFIMEGGGADLVPKKRRTPWKSILTSTAVWGLVASHAGSAAGYLLVLTQIPSYMNFVLGVEIKKNGLYSSLPYMAMYGTALLFGFLSDHAANKKTMSIVNIRRTANTIGMVVSGVCLVGFSYISSTVPALIMLILTMALHSAVHVGFHINQIDLAPNFAGPIMALGNMVANLASLLVPVIVSNIVRDDMYNQGRWQIVFMIFAGFQILTNIVFVIFVKGSVQPWNFYGEDESQPDDEKTTTNGCIKNSDVLTKT